MHVTVNSNVMLQEEFFPHLFQGFFGKHFVMFHSTRTQ